MTPPRGQQNTGRRGIADYEEVPDRLARFYASYPEGSVSAELIADDGKRVVMRAYAHRSPDDPRPGVGHAEEVRGEGMVNKTSAVENCETSAWGRALAALGYTGKKIASFEEVEQARAAASAPTAPVAPAVAPAATPAPAVEVVDAGTIPREGVATLEHASGDTIARIGAAFKASGKSADWLKLKLVEITGNDVDKVPAAMAAMTLDQAFTLYTALGGAGDLLDDGIPGSGA